MKKRNLAIHTAVATALLTLTGISNAGTLATTFKTYASEVFGAGSSATVITPTPITYQFGVPVAANQTVNFYVSLSGGAKFVTAAVAAVDFKCRDAANASVTATAAALANDNTYAVFTFATGANGLNTNSTCTFIPQTGSVNNADSALSVNGGVITATFTSDANATAVLTGVPSGGTNFDSTGVRVGNIAQSAAAITARYIPSSSFPFTPSGGTAIGALETKRIDVSATPTGALFTVGSNGVASNRVNLGALLFSQTAGIQDDGTGADYTLAKATATGLSAVITGDFSLAETAAASAGVFLATDLACTAQIAAPAAGAVTINAGKTTATITGGTLPTNNVPMFVCMSIKSTNTTVIPASAYTATASLAKTVNTELPNTVASSPLLTTSLNGQVVDVRSYIPASVVGYTSFVRVINGGSVAAPITGVWLYENGTLGTSGTLISSLPAGGSITLTAAQIEATTVGAPAVVGSNRPRLRISGATNAMNVQSFFLTNSNGNFSDVTGAQ